MAKLKLNALGDDKPVKVVLELPAPIHRNLVAYAAALDKETGQLVGDATRLIAPMLERFMASDRAFTKSASHDPAKFED